MLLRSIGGMVFFRGKRERRRSSAGCVVVPCAEANCLGIVVLPAGIFISLTFVSGRHKEYRESEVRRIMIIMEGQGVGEHVGDEFSPSLRLVFFFFTMVSNGVDRMRFPCSALNVKVVRNSKQARTNHRRNHDPLEGGHVCSDRSSLSSSLLLFSC